MIPERAQGNDRANTKLEDLGKKFERLYRFTNLDLITNE